MKLTQHKKEKKSDSSDNLFKNSLVASIVGFLSWIILFVVFIPLAGFYKFGSFGEVTPWNILKVGKLYFQSIFVGFLFFFFFYLTLKYKESKAAKLIMWIGIILYALFYLGYLFLLFFFRFTDL